MLGWLYTNEQAAEVIGHQTVILSSFKLPTLRVAKESEELAQVLRRNFTFVDMTFPNSCDKLLLNNATFAFRIDTPPKSVKVSTTELASKDPIEQHLASLV
jgi:hypothetical protein